jgi:hypothetical protein
MNAAEIIRNLIAIVDQPEPTKPELANSPNEQTLDTETIFSMGDDMHHSKNPSDIRTNAPSMYPDYQAKN